jgi:hypothetical protein
MKVGSIVIVLNPVRQAKGCGEIILLTPTYASVILANGYAGTYGRSYLIEICGNLKHQFLSDYRLRRDS